MSFNYSIRIQQDNIFRFWIAVLTFVVCTLFSFSISNNSFLWVAVLYLSYNLIFGLSHLLAKRGPLPPLMQYFLIAVDSLAITIAVGLSGELRSPLYILYIVLFGLTIYRKSLSNFIYAVVLSGLLYSGLLLQNATLDRNFLFSVLGQLVLIVLLTGVLYAVLVLMERDKKVNERLVSRAKTLAHISDVLSGSLENSRDWIKKVTKMIEEEVSKDGLKCRVVLHKNDYGYLPPASGRVGLQVPIMVGEYIFGTLIVTKTDKRPMGSGEEDFFSSIARSLGLSLHRAKLWEDIQNQLQRVEAK
ncbi:MAG: hypothetical protein LHV69_10955, partial [Elusimicrobia bacterium]|nr:hypothetical protein [Candidatus Obscuribacterium magneticum]